MQHRRVFLYYTTDQWFFKTIAATLNSSDIYIKFSKNQKVAVSLSSLCSCFYRPVGKTNTFLARPFLLSFFLSFLPSVVVDDVGKKESLSQERRKDAKNIRKTTSWSPPALFTHIGKMREVTAFEILLENHNVYEHILQQIFLSLDGKSIKNLRTVNKHMKSLVDRLVWQSRRGRKCMKQKLLRK